MARFSPPESPDGSYHAVPTVLGHQRTNFPIGETVFQSAKRTSPHSEPLGRGTDSCDVERWPAMQGACQVFTGISVSFIFGQAVI